MGSSYTGKHAMDEILPDWRTKSLLEVLKETGIFTCGFCGVNIYEINKKKDFNPGDTIHSSDFKGLNGYPDPIEGNEMICPNCKGPMLYDK